MIILDIFLFPSLTFPRNYFIRFSPFSSPLVNAHVLTSIYFVDIALAQEHPTRGDLFHVFLPYFGGTSLERVC